MTEPSQIYKYKFVSTERAGGGDIEEEVNRLIAEGWEYVETASTSRWGSTEELRATVVMRRAKDA